MAPQQPLLQRRRTIAGKPSNRDMVDGSPPKQYFEDPYSYVLNFDDVAPAGVSTQSIQILAAADFKWIKSTYQSDIDAAAFLTSTQPIPNATVQITESGTGRQMFSNPIPIGAFFGFGTLPFILPIAKIFSARSSVQFQVVNYDATVTYNIQLAIHGMNMFESG